MLRPLLKKEKGERSKGNWDIFATRAHKPVYTGRSFYANFSVRSPFINQSSGIWMGVARLLLCNVSLHPLPDFNELKGKDIDIWTFDQINVVSWLIWFHIKANWHTKQIDTKYKWNVCCLKSQDEISSVRRKKLWFFHKLNLFTLTLLNLSDF